MNILKYENMETKPKQLKMHHFSLKVQNYHRQTADSVATVLLRLNAKTSSPTY